MPTKWSEPKENWPPPKYLDPAREITESEPKLPPAAFIVECVETLLRLGVPIWQACEIVANTRNETGDGKYYRGRNLGGVKVYKPYVDRYKAAHGGQGPRWYRAPGNKAPGATVDDFKGGDAPWVFYIGYDDFTDYFERWVKTFVPKPRPTDTRAKLEPKREETANYKLTGFLFWNRNPEWFGALCDAGYKGRNTDANWQPSYRSHLGLAHDTRERWAQSRLGVVPDGVWGPRSQAACAAWQQAHGIAPAAGHLDDATFEALARKPPP